MRWLDGITDTMDVSLNEQLEMVERLEDEGKIIVIRPEEPIVVGRMETSTKKLTDLYYQGYACAKKVMER